MELGDVGESRDRWTFAAEVVVWIASAVGLEEPRCGDLLEGACHACLAEQAVHWARGAGRGNRRSMAHREGEHRASLVALVEL